MGITVVGGISEMRTVRFSIRSVSMGLRFSNGDTLVVSIFSDRDVLMRG